MEGSSWRPVKGEPAADGPAADAPTSSDWRSQLHPEARQRIVNKIMETLEKHLPGSVSEGLSELKNIAVRFEEKIYTAAANQSDYLRKISLKMLSMENKTQSTATNIPPSANQTGNQNPVDPASLGTRSQVGNHGQSLALPSVNHSPIRPPVLPQNLQNTTATSALPSVSGLSQSSAPNLGQTSNLHNMTGLSQNSVNSSAGATSNMYANAQRQMQGRQQQQQSNISQQHQQPSQNSFLFQQQLQQHLLKQKMSHPSLLQNHIQQQQQLQSSQQSLMQMTSGFQSGHSANLTAQQTSLQQNQQHSSSIHQSASSLMQQHPQSVGRQQSQSSIHQQSSSLQQPNPIPQQSGLQSQQQQLMAQQSNMSNMQQSQNNLMTHQTASSHHQQQLGAQNNISGLQQNQRSMHIMQQTNTTAQQQTQQPSLTLLQSQGQLPQHQSSQQQMISQIQSQPQHLQQQLVMQQQSNSLQRDMQQRLQASGALLQSQNMVEQQKQFIQSQRAHPEVSSSTAMRSTPQVGHGGTDVQEEIYQKIKSMKESYFSELNEYYQRIALKFQQHEALIPATKQSEQFEKMRSYKNLIERMLSLLQMSKGNIQPALKDRLPIYEKQIITFIASSRNKRTVPSQSQGQQQQHLSGHANSMQQQQSSQMSQLQQRDNQVSQVQQINLQGSLTTTQSGTAPPSSIQQNMANAVQPASSLDSVQGSSFGSLQQGNLVSLQNTVNPLLQSSVNSLQHSSSPVQHQNLKQEQQQQQLMQAQQMKQQLQQRHMQQLMQQSNKQQILQQQSSVHQQLHQQQKQQQMPPLNQMTDGNELKARQGPGIKLGLHQQNYPSGQRLNYYHQQLKGGAPFPASSPQIAQASSPQISQHSSPQIDQQNILPSLPKAGTPLQSASSPFVVPSPSTPIAPSPLPGDGEKLSGLSSIPNAVSIAPTQAQSLAVSTPGISASPLLAEFTSPDASQANVSTALSGKLTVTERPLERLIKVVQSLSPAELNSSIRDIGSVVSMIDRTAGSAPGNGSRAAVGEDLVAMTQCRLQARNLISQDGCSTTKKMKRHTVSMPSSVVSSAGSVNDIYGFDTSELESTATSNVKRHKVEVNHALLEEIREINQQLIDIVVSISDEAVDSMAAAAEVGEGTIVKCSFSAVALSPSLKSQFASAQSSPILPLRLLVPSNYPNYSPIVLEKLPVELSTEFQDLSVKARSRFSTSLRSLSQPMSLGEMVRTWDFCARKVIREYAQQTGGGVFSSRYGAWESCVKV